MASPSASDEQRIVTFVLRKYTVWCTSSRLGPHAREIRLRSHDEMLGRRGDLHHRHLCEQWPEEGIFNLHDGAGEDPQGAQRPQTFYTEGTNEIHAGELSPAGTATGNVCFESPISKVVFQESFWSDEEATWIVP